MSEKKELETKVKENQSRFENRIVGSGEVELDAILFNPRNWRIHPLYQQDALKGVLEEVGWVQQVIINKRTGNLVDGHLRCQLAAREGATEIPALFIDVSEEDEMKILATLDPIGAMAVSDKEKQKELMSEIDKEETQLNTLLEEMAAESGLIAVPKEKRRAGASQPYLPIEYLSPCDYSHTAMTENELKTLKKSIMRVGILMPLIVRPLPEGGYEVVDGNQRLKAARELNMGQVPVTVKNLTRREAIIARIAVDEISGKTVISKLTKDVAEIGDDDLLNASAGMSRKRLDSYKFVNSYPVTEDADGFLERQLKDYDDVEAIEDGADRILMIKLSAEDYEKTLLVLAKFGKDINRAFVKLIEKG